MKLARRAMVRQAVAAAMAVVPLVLLAGCLSGPAEPTSTRGRADTAVSPRVSGSIASPSVPTSPKPAPSAAVVGTRPAPCPGSDRTPGAPPGRQVLGSSSNWSGYVAAVSRTGVTCVEGSWVEPSITCSRSGHQAVAIWIGVDGFSARVVGVPATDVLVQIGTQADCHDGVATHGAWHEILPGEANEVPVPGVIRAGDHLSARIAFAGGKFTMSLFDAETHLSYSLTAPAPGAPRRTAEWIVEAPATACPGTCRPVALPKFTPVVFTGARATIGGQRGPINNDSWANVKLKMVRGGITRTATSKLSAGGTAFRITFVHT